MIQSFYRTHTITRLKSLPFIPSNFRKVCNENNFYKARFSERYKKKFNLIKTLSTKLETYKI